MVDISKRLFVCFAWEDSGKVKAMLQEIEHELKAKIASNFESQYSGVLDEATLKKLDESEILVVLISDASKQSGYVKECITHASNINKNILPIEIEKQGVFSSTPEEFKFRAKPYSFLNNDSKAQLFAQLKATLGLNMESGDDFGALIHVVTDRTIHISRYGKDLGVAKAGSDNKIRLVKGEHLLDFVAVSDSSLKCSIPYEVKSNNQEQFLNVPFNQLIKEKQENEEKAQREAEIKRQFEEDQYKKKLEEEQKKKEKEEQWRQQQLQWQREAQERERQAKIQTSKNDDSSSGCMWVVWLILAFITLGGIFSLL